MENREMFTEITTLVGSIAKAMELSEEETVKALESQAIAIAMAEDDDGQRFIALEYQGKKARLYKGAIYYGEAEANN